MRQDDIYTLEGGCDIEFLFDLRRRLYKSPRERLGYMIFLPWDEAVMLIMMYSYFLRWLGRQIIFPPWELVVRLNFFHIGDGGCRADSA